MQALSDEIDELVKKSNEVEKEEPERTAPAEIKTREVVNMNLSEREIIRQALAKEDSAERKFISDYVMAAMEKRAFEAGPQIIPESFMGILHDRTYKGSRLLPLVNVVNAKGKMKFLVDSKLPDFVWTEKCADIPELTLGALGTLELDRYALGGYIAVCNAIIEDAMIDVADYLLDKMSAGRAKAIDLAILNGQGSAANQPEGILTKVTNTATATSIQELMDAEALVGALDTEDATMDGAMTLVMNPADYYTVVKPATFVTTSNGQLVATDVENFRALPDGVSVVLTKRIPKGTGLLGYFKSYFWRNAMNETVMVLREIRALNRQTVFAIDGAHDGKVAFPDNFVKITISAPVKPEA